jgi:curved DNA-binding protein CbpA
MLTHYTTLQVEQDASLECIKKAYRKIQLENHPDKTKSLPEAQRFDCENVSKAANVAYEILSDPAQRSMYDNRLFAKIPHGPQPEPQQPQTPPTWTAESKSAPKEETNPSDTPYTPFCRPGKFPIELHIKGVFSFSIRLEGAYEPYDWGPRLVFEEGDKVTILMNIRPKPQSPPEKPDVAVAVSSTPSGRRVTKIESLMKVLGSETTLRVTIFAAANSGGHLYKEIMENRLNNSRAWHYSWNLNSPDLTQSHRPIPRDASVWGECQVFMAEKPHQRAIFLPKPRHEDNPWGVLLRDKNLKRVVGEGQRLKLMASTTWLQAREMEVKGTKMWRIAASAHRVVEKRVPRPR